MVIGKNKIIYPPANPDLSGNEMKYLIQSLREGWISWRGPWVERLHKEFSERHGALYGVSCTSGTTALTLALRALNIGEGDEVIVPEFTMIATAWAVSYNNAKPVFVDCDKKMLIDLDKIQEKITPRTKAIIPVHAFGRRVDMYRLNHIAKELNGLKIVEDAALAHGIESQADVTCYSFFANKILTAGEGGICVTNDKGLAERMMFLRNASFDKEHTFYHAEQGFNFRMTTMQAAIALAQLERLEEFLEKRKQIEKWYNNHLKDIPQITILPERDVVWEYDLFAENKDKLMKYLLEEGIDSRHYFKPMSSQPQYLGEYENLYAYEVSKKGFYLPTYTQLNENDIKFICNKIKDFYKNG